jgi:glycosidase
LGSKRQSDNGAIINDTQLSKEMVLTMAMLYGGTPVVLYGEELGLDQVKKKHFFLLLIILIRNHFR